VPTPPPTGSSLIQNGDFEQGSDPWQESSAAGYEIVDTTNPHSGQYSAYLCGYGGCSDSIGQDFTVPNNATKITVSYWWYGYTNRHSSSCRDAFNATLLDSNGNAVKKLQHACNTDATSSWKQVSFDVTNLSNYGGQTVTLVFSAKTANTTVTTAFFVDDVVVSAS